MKKILIGFCSFLMVIMMSYAQKDINQGLGVFASYNLNQYHSEFSQLPNVPNCCPQFTNGEGSGFGAGLYYEMPFTPRLSLQFRLAYLSLAGDFSEIEYEQIIYNDELTDANIRHDLNIDLSTLSLGLYFRYKFFEGLSFLGGINGGYPIQKGFSQQEVLVQPKDYGTFENGSRIRNVQEGDIEDITSLLILAEIGLSYDVPLNKRQSFYLVPEMFYSFGINDVISAEKWLVSSFRVGLSVRYSTSFDFATPLTPQN